MNSLQCIVDFYRHRVRNIWNSLTSPIPADFQLSKTFTNSKVTEDSDFCSLHRFFKLGARCAYRGKCNRMRITNDLVLENLVVTCSSAGCVWRSDRLLSADCQHSRRAATVNSYDRVKEMRHRT